MKSALDNLDSELLELLLSTLEERYLDAEARVVQAQDEASHILEKIERIRAKLEPRDEAALVPDIEVLRAPSGRMKKGESERLIRECLQSRNGSGATVKDVMATTLTTYATAYRILHSLAERGLATECDNVFHWNAVRVRQRGIENLQLGNGSGEGGGA